MKGLSAAASERRSFWVEILETDRSIAEVFRPRFQHSEWARLDDLERRALLKPLQLRNLCIDLA